MNDRENQRAPFPGRAKQARQTWLWTHLFFGLLFVAVAVIIYQKSDRMVLALIFGLVGLVELVNAIVNPFQRARK